MQPTTSLEVSRLAEGDFRDKGPLGLVGTRLEGVGKGCGGCRDTVLWAFSINVGKGTQNRVRQEGKFLSFFIACKPDLSLQPSPATIHYFLFTLQTGKATLSAGPLQIFYTKLIYEHSSTGHTAAGETLPSGFRLGSRTDHTML